MDAVPSGVLMLFKGITEEQRPVLQIPDRPGTPVGRICFLSTKNNNKGVCHLFQSDVICVPCIANYWCNLVKDLIWKNLDYFPFK